MPSKPRINFTRPPQWDAERQAGLRVTEEMKTLIAKPGFLNSENGGPRLRYLYANESLQFAISHLELFAMACYFGNIEHVTKGMQSSDPPDLSKKETPFEWGYASLVVLGSQRVATTEGGPRVDHLEVLRYLIPHGLSLDVSDIAGYTALHHTVLAPTPKQKKMTKALLKAGANVNCQNKWGETPVHAAMARDDIVGLEIFLEAGADVTIKDGNGAVASGGHVVCGPRVSATVQKWLRIRSGTAHPPMAEKACARCGDKKSALKSCGRCRTVQYCSTECQGASWKSHKQSCKPFDEASSLTVKPHYANGAKSYPRSELERGSILGLPTKPVLVSHLRASNVPDDIPSGGKQFVIKIQAPNAVYAPAPDGSYMGLYVYTWKRDFVCSIRRDTSPADYDRLTNIIRQNPPSYQKVYFAATLKSPQELVIKVSEVLADQPW
ncbi:hypothetical protein FA15DRAFT_118555 [Coprinopsis marcescibilis]|uniref:MYND-type domain-containing protein n=1 Tax=Coprinopsis marcescibilis TaxID=230819 RepID=A0A5C3L5P8_COPMA|nr:hypothetical protein FA15DRAFT_118555 [Coprinopsis marcescibilis]